MNATTGDGKVWPCRHCGRLIIIDSAGTFAAHELPVCEPFLAQMGHEACARGSVESLWIEQKGEPN